MKNDKKTPKNEKNRKTLQDNDFGMIKYGVPDDELDAKETKKSGELIGKHPSTKQKLKKG